MNKEKAMNRKIFLLSALMMVLVEAGAQAPFRKYDIRSGVVTYELTMKIGTTELKTKSIVYFDDYGMKECKETYSNNQLSQSYFSDGKNVYAVKHKQKTAYNRGPAYRGTEPCVEWSELGTEMDRQSGKIKRQPAMTVAGKECEVFVSGEVKGDKTLWGGWKKILMFMETGAISGKTTLRAVNVEENAKVPPEKFQIPAGFKMQ
jgi:hypothetical protein